MSRRVAAALIVAAALGLARRAHAQDAVATPRPPSRLRDPEAQSDFQRLWTEESPLTFHLPRQAIATFYGGERLSLYRDSTQSFGAATHDNPIAEPGSYLGSHEQWSGSFADSRWGAKLETPANASFSGIFLVELGLRGADRPGAATVQTRHLFFGVRTPVVDVLLGQTDDLFAWGGRVPFPSTIASLGVPGEIYRRRTQIRLTHVFRFQPVDFELAACATQPFHTDGYSYDRQLGIRLAINAWRGAADQNGGPAATMPAQLGLSGVRRRFLVDQFSAMPAGSYSVIGDGLALNAFVPIVPSHGDDLSNATSLSLEVSAGSGLADLYSGLTGGATIPVLPNPQMTLPPPYVQTFPTGVVTFDAGLKAQTIDWRAIVLNFRYHLPIAQGRRIWAAATWSRTTSSNLRALTPSPGWGAIYPETRYYDASAFVSIWKGIHAALSYQVTRQLYAAGPDHENRRAQLLVAYYF
ncbi:MAG: hypothetical protein JWM82_888 [Myxococcales bacterium]|nr:hypothetical protein [Myxococcales bacterium]